MTAPKPHSLKWLLPLLIALASLAISAYGGYNANDKDTAQRITKVETHVEDDRQTLGEIKDAVKDLDAKLTELLLRVPR